MYDINLQNSEEEVPIEEVEIIEEKKEEPKSKKTASERINELTYKHREEERKNAELKTKVLELENKLQKEENDKLKQGLKVAMEEGDTEKVVEIQDQMFDLKVKGQTVQPTQVSNTDIENYFKQKNPWFGQDNLMTIDAEAEDKKLLLDPSWKNVSYTERLDEVARRVTKKYKNNTPPMADGVPNYSSGGNSNSFKITDEEIRQTSKMLPGLSRKQIEEKIISWKKGEN